MGASKRSNYSSVNSRGSAGREAARNLGVVVGLGGLSFFLGFFVLSRMVPDKHEESGVASAATVAHSSQSAPAPAPSEPPTSSASAAPNTSEDTPRKPRTVGPLVEQGEDVTTQHPGDVEGTVKSGTSTTADGSATATPNKTDAASGLPSNTDESTPATTGTTTTSGHKGRKGRTADADTTASGDSTDNGGFSEDSQKPSSIDPAESTSTARTRHKGDAATPAVRSDRSKTGSEDTASTSDTTPKRGRYVVRGTAYSRREAAEREARHITDLGLEASVQPVTLEDGTTVYRVQQGVYRYRSNADKARQKMTDAGIEAEVVKVK